MDDLLVSATQSPFYVPAANPAAPATADGVAAGVVQPAPVVPVGYQAGVSGGQVATGGASVLAVVVLGFLWRDFVKHKGAKWVHMIVAFSMGVLLAGSFAGLMVHNLTNAGAGAAANMVGQVGGTGR